jgi:hypothetical protein
VNATLSVNMRHYKKHLKFLNMKSKAFTFILLLVISGTQFLFAQKTETRKLSAFTEISLRIGANIHLSQGNEQTLEMKGSESTLKKIITEVKDRKLVIRYPTESFFSNKWNPGPVDIFITIPQIDELAVLGSGSIIAEDKIESRILDLTVSGNGDIRIGNLKTEKVTSILSGSGSLYLTGQPTASEFKCALSGSGNVKAVGFAANDINIKIGGSGSCWVTATKNLAVRIVGSGSVYYHGNPAVDSSIVGSGQIKKEE